MSILPRFIYALRVKGTGDTYLKLTPKDGLHDGMGSIGALCAPTTEEAETIRSKVIDPDKYEIMCIRSAGFGEKIKVVPKN